MRNVLPLLGILLLLSCHSRGQKDRSVPEQALDTEDKTLVHVPDSFRQFIDFLPEWTADTIGTADIFYYDADVAPAYAGRFDMRNELEEKESIDVSPLFMYKVTLDGCYVIFVEKHVYGGATSDGFYASRWTHSMMTCTKDGRMIEKADLGNSFYGRRGYSHIRGTRSPLRLEVENVYCLVGNGEEWRAPQPSRICRMEYHVDPKSGHISRDTTSVYDCDRYIANHWQSVWKNQRKHAAKSRSKAIAAGYQRPQTAKQWIECFPEWTADSISEHIFDASGLVPEELVFPKEFRPVAAQDSARRQRIEMRYGHRITTDSLYILFARKVCSRRNGADNLVPESFFTQIIMVYSHDGQLKGWCDLTRGLPSKNRTHVSGRRSPFRLHVKEVTLRQHDYEHTHYIPVLFREIEWTLAQGGILASDTLSEEECKWYPYKHPGVCEPWHEQLSISQSESVARYEPPQEEVDVPTIDFDSLDARFPLWTEGTITRKAFESRHCNSGGHRIDTAGIHVLFLANDLDEHSIIEGYPHCSYELVTLSTKGKLIDKMELMRFGDFWSGILSGTRQPLRLHVEKRIQTDVEGEFKPYPIHTDEIEVSITSDGNILADTLRSYISYGELQF